MPIRANPSSTDPATAERPDAEPAWEQAEQLILGQIAELDRWEAERWAAGHERQLPPVSLMALRASYMQAAINSDKSVYLEHVFGDIAVAVDRVATTTWAVHPVPDAEHQSAFDETVAAVTQIAQLALAAMVLTGEPGGRLPEHRRHQLDSAMARFHGTEAAAGRQRSTDPI